MFDGWFIIANPFSNSGKTAEIIDLAVKKLQSNLIRHQIRLTERSGDEMAFVREATQAGYNKILAIGGDGTVQKVVAGITTVYYTHLTLPTKRIV